MITAGALTHLAHWSIEFLPGFVLYILACLGCGFPVVWLALQRNGSRERPAYFIFAISFLFGLGALGQLWTLLALGGAMRPIYVGCIVGAFAIVAIGWGVRNFAVLRRLGNTFATELCKESVGIRLLTLAVTLWMALGLTSLGSRMSGDALALHMKIGKVVAASGALQRQWFSVNNEYYGLLGEMTYAALMQLANADAARMFTWAASLAAALVLVGVCDRAGLGLRGKVLALAMMFSSTTVLAWVGEGKIDLFASALGLAGVSLLVPCRTGAPAQRGDLVLSGLLIGFAITCKLILGFCLAILSLILFSWTALGEAVTSLQARAAFIRKAVAPTLTSGCIFVVAIIAGLMPHFVKNGVLLGMPIAPLNMPGEWFIDERWYGAHTVSRIRLLYPFVLSFGEYVAQFGHLSPLVLGCLPLAIFLRRPRRLQHSALTAISVAAFIAIGAWAVQFGDKAVPRYFMPALLLCIPLASRAAENVTDTSFRPRYLSVVVMSFVFAVLFLTARFTMGVYFHTAQAIKLVLGTAAPCEGAWDWCRPMMAVNELAPKGTRVFSVSKFKYYLRPDLIQCANEHRTGLVVFPGASTLDRWQWFYANGFRVILPDSVNNPPTLQEDIINAPEWVVVHRNTHDDPLDPIWISYDLTKPGSPHRSPAIICKNIRGDYWLPVRATVQ
jgi:hypothetical protein